MIKVSVLYPYSEGKKFDHDYYKANHIPLIKKRLGQTLRNAYIDKGMSGITPGSKSPFVCIGHLLFDSLEEYRTSFAPHAEEIRADIPKYTDIQPLIQISEIIE